MNRFALAAAALLVITNAYVLGGVAWNRSGEPVSSLTLTERELGLNHYYRGSRENSGISLTLHWRVFDPHEDNEYLYLSGRSPAWLDADRLRELGLDIEDFSQSDRRHRYRADDYATPTILVMEYDGETRQQALRQAETVLAKLRRDGLASPSDQSLANRLDHFEKEVKRLRHQYSRLYVIDAGTDRDELVEKYGARENLLFLKGEVGLMWRNDKPVGYVRRLLNNRIHVPLPHAERLSALSGRAIRHAPPESVTAPRYSVLLNTGQRLEPWVESVSVK